MSQESREHQRAPKKPAPKKAPPQRVKPLTEHEKQSLITRDIIASLLLPAIIAGTSLYYGHGGIRDWLENRDAKAIARQEPGAIEDPNTGIFMSPKIFAQTQALDAAGDPWVTDVICGTRARLRLSGMKGARAINQCLVEWGKQNGKDYCMPIDSSTRSQGDQLRIIRSGNPRAAGLIDTPHYLGTHWDVSKTTARRLEDAECICVGANKAPKDEDGEPAIYCGGYKGVVITNSKTSKKAPDPQHIYPGGPLQNGWTTVRNRGVLETGKSLIGKAWRGLKSKVSGNKGDKKVRK